VKSFLVGLHRQEHVGPLGVDAVFCVDEVFSKRSSSCRAPPPAAGTTAGNGPRGGSGRPGWP
jgi:hypothetical protein